MKTYAMAHLTHVALGPEIIGYLEGIDATLAPFQGRFIIHGGPPELLEGSWSGDVIVIEFPNRAAAKAWYESEAYQAILPLRIRNSTGAVFFIDGVSSDHLATDVLRRQ
ncbi:DUF1330 domain-containing protein [Bosea sp. BIWAKO-01]|uniref:DUF1330 domain-containing protein n=1 Tax=Bosea sp. BIWAKO-01 TaxID=506668 RepID=UPI0008532671|nr:DUF1330 domain-containing protein [Bosea sp. BIWAKO-01]GAU82522.1 hypothetical protein BIWAKO_02441 [Bosea sp. BIWAKO-01]